jgi:hypothetical protein
MYQGLKFVPKLPVAKQYNSNKFSTSGVASQLNKSAVVQGTDDVKQRSKLCQKSILNTSNNKPLNSTGLDTSRKVIIANKSTPAKSSFRLKNEQITPGKLLKTTKV